jgi:chromosome segregation ATPase
MSDIEQLEGRITAALDRISKGLDGLTKPAASQDATASAEAEAEIARLTQALEDERTVSSQLEERVRDIKAKLEERSAEMARSQEKAQASMATLDAELQQLRDINDKLRASNTALRDANAAGVADPELINASLQMELESMRAALSADRAEIGAVLTQLDTILGDAESKENADA